MDQVAIKGAAARQTLLQNDAAAHRGDVALDTDLKVVDRGGEVRNELGLEYHAHRLRSRDFGLQIGVAALQTVVLVRWIRIDVAELRRGYARPRALRRCKAVDQSAHRRTRARIGREIQTDGLRRIQLVDVRRTHGALIAGTEQDIFHRRPVKTHLVGAGLESQVVIGIAVAALERQRVGAGHHVGDRYARFHEYFLHTDAA